MPTLSRRLPLLALVLSSLSLSTGGCIIVIAEDWDDDHAYHSGSRVERTFAADFDSELLSATEGLRIDNKRGRIEIEPSDGPARIVARVRGQSRDRVNAVRIDQSTEGDALVLTPVWPDDRWTDREVVDLYVIVPTRTGVTLNTSAGDIEVAGMAGWLEASTSAGDVEVRTHDGPARIKTSAGEITMEHVAGDVEARTSAGDIDLHDVGWPIEAITSAGDITVSMRPGFSGQMRASTSAGDIRLPDGTTETRRNGSTESATLTLGDGTDECVFKTSAGDVDVDFHNG